MYWKRGNDELDLQTLYAMLFCEYFVNHFFGSLIFTYSRQRAVCTQQYRIYL